LKEKGDRMLSKGAVEKTKIVKNMADIIRISHGAENKQWHVYTTKKNEDIIDPDRFVVYQTVSVLGSEPMPKKKHMDVLFDESRKNIDIVIRKKLYLTAMSEIGTLNKCLVDMKYGKWSLNVDKKKGIGSWR
jgi:predicted P-loop ATPase/GTPase